MKTLILILSTLIYSTAFSQTEITGLVIDKKSGERLPGAAVYCKAQQKGTTTDLNGEFKISLTLPCKLEISYIGYSKQVIDAKDKKIIIKLSEQQNQLSEVTITASAKSTIEKNQTGTVQLSAKDIAFIPSLGGERDAIKVMQLMPGVQTTNQASAAMLIRGGEPDQTLFLLDGVPVYNPTHTLGFFSVFNTVIIKEVTLQKGGFDARYNDRVSGILDVSTKTSDFNKPHVHASVGLLASSLVMELPMYKNKAAVSFSVRRSYIDQVMKFTPNRIPAYFYDMNARFSYMLSKKALFSINAYNGKDVLYLDKKSLLDPGNGINMDFATTYGNRLLSFKVDYSRNASISEKWIAYYSGYHYNVINSFEGNSMNMTSNINELGAKFQQKRKFSTNYNLEWGGDMSRRNLAPNRLETEGQFNELVSADDSKAMTQTMNGMYATLHTIFSSRHEVSTGLRAVAVYTNSWRYGIEPRLTYSYHVSASSRLLASYSLMRQYTHLVGSNNVSLPTDMWYPSTKNISPQESHQVTLGYHFNLVNKHTSFTVEVYHKTQNNLIEFKEGSTMFINNKIENDMVIGKGAAYGVELFLKKKLGNFSGTASYTWSRSIRQFDELNNGMPFYARYDRRHVFHITMLYDFNKRISLASVWSASSGSRFTPVIGKYYLPVDNLSNFQSIPIYGKINSLVLAPQHRLDINLIIKNRTGSKFNAEWHIGAYNVYNQVQPYKVTAVVQQNGSTKYYQTGLFGFMPSISYQIIF